MLWNIIVIDNSGGGGAKLYNFKFETEAGAEAFHAQVQEGVPLVCHVFYDGDPAQAETAKAPKRR
jgi:hypothetical protein